jgi:AraC-like DNA-binding protein
LVGVLIYDRAADPTCVEELLLDLVHEAVSGPSNSKGTGNLASSSRATRRNLDRVETIRCFLLDHWAERITLKVLAAKVDCSRWHLATLFRAHVGLAIYRYLKRLRLRHALARLQDGYADLTRLALECGFNSHSHLSMAFRQEFGTTPSSIRHEYSTGIESVGRGKGSSSTNTS